MADTKLKEQVESLAKRECSDYADGLCISEDVPCHVISSRYDLIRDGAVDCDCFMGIVLPLDPELETKIRKKLRSSLSGSGQEEKTCAGCGKGFIPTGNRQLYCGRCRGIRRRLQNRERKNRCLQKKSPGQRFRDSESHDFQGFQTPVSGGAGETLTPLANGG